MKSDTILICYDGSEEAERAIGAAAELLAPRRAIVLDIGPELTPAESVASASGLSGPASFQELNADEALKSARAGALRAERAGFEAEARGLVAAPVWEGIVAVGAEIDAAVIVLGSRGESGARELLDGSVSHEVAEHAGRPVLIVPPANGHR